MYISREPFFAFLVSSQKIVQIYNFIFIYASARELFMQKNAKKVKNKEFSIFNFQLSIIYCTFASYFGIVCAFYKKIGLSVFNYQFSVGY